MPEVVLETSDEEPQPRKITAWDELFDEAAGVRRRELPRLVVDAVRLVWSAGRRELALTAILSVLIAVGVGAQLLIGKAALGAVISAREDGFAHALPALAVLVAVTVALELAQAVEGEQSRVLAELAGRRALDRVLDVATRVDLVAFESPEFHDRLRRAQAQGQFRSLQTVQGLLGLGGAAVAAVGVVVALAALQPLLVPLVLLGYVPLWLASAANSRDFYDFSFGMTPNDRQRIYLQHVLLDRGDAKEVRAFGLAPFLRRRYDRLYDERIAELRALAGRRTRRGARRVACLGRRRRGLGRCARVALRQRPDEPRRDRCGSLRPLSALGPPARDALQRRLALRIDALHS